MLPSLTDPAPAATPAPDPLNPVFKGLPEVLAPDATGRDESNEPTPGYTREERQRLAEDGQKLFFSRDAWGQRAQPGPGRVRSGPVLRQLPRPAHVRRRPHPPRGPGP